MDLDTRDFRQNDGPNIIHQMMQKFPTKVSGVLSADPPIFWGIQRDFFGISQIVSNSVQFVPPFYFGPHHIVRVFFYNGTFPDLYGIPILILPSPNEQLVSAKSVRLASDWRSKSRGINRCMYGDASEIGECGMKIEAMTFLSFD